MIMDNCIYCDNFVMMIRNILQYCEENKIDHKNVIFLEDVYGYKIGDKKWIMVWDSLIGKRVEFSNADYFNITKLSFEDVVYILNNKIDQKMIIRYFDQLYANEELKTYIRMFI